MQNGNEAAAAPEAVGVVVVIVVAGTKLVPVNNWFEFVVDFSSFTSTLNAPPFEDDAAAAAAPAAAAAAADDEEAGL